MSVPLRILSDFISTPTAPFHEHRLAAKVRAFARKRRLELAEDRWGNLRVTWRGARTGTPWVVTGHMDHPGFTILGYAPERAQASARWTGGVRPDFFRSARVVVYTPTGAVRGRVAGVALDPKTKRVVTMELDLPRPVARGDFGSWDLVPYALKDGVVSSKSIDDLGGCAVAASVVDAAARARLPVTVMALFTRGEEAGFIGALGAVRSGLIPRRARIVNVEASSCRVPGVAAGAGPIVRTGDRMMTFDPGITLALTQAAERVSSQDRKFRFQRALMTGGACEASAFTLAGHRCGAMALPLVNYHNMSPRGRIAPERIHLADYLGCVRVVLAAVSARADAEDGADLLARFGGSFEKLAPRLDNPLNTLPGAARGGRRPRTSGA